MARKKVKKDGSWICPACGQNVKLKFGITIDKESKVKQGIPYTIYTSAFYIPSKPKKVRRGKAKK